MIPFRSLDGTVHFFSHHQTTLDLRDGRKDTLRYLCGAPEIGQHAGIATKAGVTCRHCRAKLNIIDAARILNGVVE